MNYLKPLECGNQRILTTQQLAEAYQTTVDSLQINFKRNKDRYVENKHYYLLQGETLRNFKRDFEIFEVAENINKLYLWTERGAALHAKSLSNDTAWDIYESLVDTYFHYQDLKAQMTTQTQLQLSVIEISKEIESNLSKKRTPSELIAQAVIAYQAGLIDINTLENLETNMGVLEGYKRIYDSSECIYMLKQMAQLVDFGLLNKDVEYKLIKFQGYNAITFGTCMYDKFICNIFNLNYVGDIPSKLSFLNSLERKKYFLGYIPVPQGVPYRNENKWIVLSLDLLGSKMQVLKFGYIPLNCRE